MRLHGTLFIYRQWVNDPFAVGNYLGACDPNLPWEISMVRSKIAKKPLMTLNLVKRKGFSIAKAKQPIRFLQHETPKNSFFKRVSFALLRERSMMT